MKKLLNFSKKLNKTLPDIFEDIEKKIKIEEEPYFSLSKNHELKLD